MSEAPLTPDQRYWLDRRSDIIEALRLDGLEIRSNRERVWLHQEWRYVARDGLPPCDGDTYIGINAAGFAGCFTTVDESGECWTYTGEENICVMSGLRWWRVLRRPSK